MLKTRAEAFAPASIANLGVGFDILGLALDGAGDVVEAEWRDDGQIVIAEIRGDEGKLSHDPQKNIVGIAAQALLGQLHSKRGVTLRLKKGLPLSSGLGGSAASAVAAVMAVNGLLEKPLAREDLLAAALEGEAAVSGYHADNVAPSLFGGIILANGITIDRIHRLPVPSDLHLALVTPNVEVPTAQARAVLPSTVPLRQLVRQTGAVADLVDAIHCGDVVRMARAMEADEVIEPARAHLMPYIDEVRHEAKLNGALALVIGGAGPTLCAVCQRWDIAESVALAMRRVYDRHGLACQMRHTTVSAQGAQLLTTHL
ncbi:MAG: homoserine kinase [Anaerolineae bacterium]|nr:homoserine kinase [Anaerolineae bacterium]MDW8173305.1 homoserine kinase [Anaerolineae bacterium]